MARKKQAKKIKLKKSVLPPSSLLVYTEGPLHKTKIRVIGIGGGGGFIVSEISSRIKKASFVVANTDLQALKKSDKRARLFQFGQKLTYGLGTGMNSELGKIAAQQETEKIKKLLEGQDLCILVACLGGGVGSGAAPIFAKISRDLGNLTYGIFTLPFKFEGEKKAQIARESLKKIKPNLNAFSVIPNERIFQIIDKETPLRAALSVINKSLAESLEGLIEMIYDPGLINIDFADLKTIFEGRGRITYLNTVEVSGSDKSEEAIKKVVSNPLYPYTIRGAKGVLFNIAGEKNLGLNEISQISKTISDLANKEARIIFGISQFPFSSMGDGGRDKKYRDKIKITLLA
ncbi:cell division FtsZ family protein, partial [Patescibacteria group bacterium]|nr:cell division FtsZ family protein [Patescibacteria group bacterium]